jgi:imidazole glycerol phosphate synthase glutamine amidotransferase subunit
MKISLIEYDAGNLPSVERALARQGVACERAAAAEAVRAAEALILPGVGHFGQLMRTLGARGLMAPLAEAISRGTPLLGICLGLQALFAGSEEAPGDAGLGLYAGEVAALPATAKLPHMGWNQLQRKRPSVLLEGVPASAYFYFAHSYAAIHHGAGGAAGNAAVATCNHGAEFVAVLEQGNVFAVQFHPEKSAEAGARVLGNFVAHAASAQAAAQSRR